MTFRSSILAAAPLSLALAACQLPQTGTADAPPPSEEAVTAALADSRAAAGALGSELMGALATAMAEGGPGAALPVCNEKAPEIAARLSTERQVDIGRTALRVRNPANAPDDWERAQLEAFVSAIAAGEAPAQMERHEVVRTAEGWQVRWMKPIVLQPMCATCHGVDVDSGLAEVIHALYPQDKATGFQPGELRGAFTARVDLPR
ncbi:MAG: DUF3365 domain-containing protein [Hyphomonadaceae bacterium]